MTSEFDKVNAFLNKTFGDLVYASAPSWRKFDKLRYKYRSASAKNRQDVRFCWSTTRNINGKFLSWVYKHHAAKKEWDYVKHCEHKTRAGAKRRATRMENRWLQYKSKPAKESGERNIRGC